MSKLKRVVAALIVLCMMSVCAGAETVRGDLSERFGNEDVLIYQEKEYRPRKRMTNVLFIGLEQIPARSEEEISSAQAVMLILLAIDDNQKLVTPIMLDGEMPYISSAETEQTDVPQAENVPVMLRDVISLHDEDRTEGAQTLMDAVNAYFPTELIEDYVMLDLAGLTLLDGLDGKDYEARMRAIAGQFSDVSAGDISSVMEKLSDYLTTNMKSGAMMKVVDKADRYNRKSMLRLTVNEERLIEDERLTLFTEEAWMGMTIETFFEEKTTPW